MALPSEREEIGSHIKHLWRRFWSSGEGWRISRLCDEATLANEAADNNNTPNGKLGAAEKNLSPPIPPFTNLLSLVCFLVLCTLLQVCCKQELSSACVKKRNCFLTERGLGKIFHRLLLQKPTQKALKKRQNWEVTFHLCSWCMFLLRRSMLIVWQRYLDSL